MEPYVGYEATNYDKNRKNLEKWKKEQVVIEKILVELIQKFEKPTIIDLPIGTGRFIGLLEKLNCEVIGIDISKDMLGQALQKIKKGNIKLVQGNALDAGITKFKCDILLSIRFLNWLSQPDLEDAIRNLSNVFNKYLVLGYRSWKVKDITKNPKTLYNFLKYRFGRISRKKGRESINENKFLEILKKNNLKIGKRFWIEKRIDGTSYWIYLLVKNV